MEHQRVAIHAIAQAGRLRAVVEDMAEMAAAATAMHFRASYAVGAVFRRADGVFERLVEARPAGPAFELGLGGEQRQVAAGAGKGALAVLLQQRARSRPLGALPAQDLILLRRELGPPFGVRLFDLELLGGIGLRRAQPPEAGKAEQAGDRGEQDAAVDHGGLRVARFPDCSPRNTVPARRSYTGGKGSFSLSCEIAASAFATGSCGGSTCGKAPGTGSIGSTWRSASRS